MTTDNTVDVGNVQPSAAPASPAPQNVLSELAAQARRDAAEEERQANEAHAQDVSDMLAEELSGVSGDSGKVYLPPLIAPPKKEGGKFRIKLYADGCLCCTALMPPSPENFNRWEDLGCHFSRGNEMCPAKDIQISFSGPVYDIVRKYKKKFAALETEKKSAVHRVRILDDLSKELMNVTEPEMEEVLEQLGLKT
jgi:hypothetical protein